MKKLALFGFCSFLTLGMTQASENYYETSGFNSKESKVNCNISNFKSDIILEVQNHLKKLDDPEIASTLHCKALIQPAQELSQHISENIKKNPNLKKLINEIKYKIESEEVSPLWLLTMALRFQTAISQVSEEEKELIRNSINPGSAYVDGLANSDYWKSEISTLAILDDFDKNPNFDHIVSVPYIYDPYFKINEVVSKKILSVLKKKAPVKIEFPILKKSVLPVDFILKATLNDVYPVGMPLKNKNVHGTNLSPFTFSVHDYLHSIIDSKQGALEEHAYDLAHIGYHCGLQTSDLLVEAATNNALQKYSLLTQTLENILEGIREDKKALAGMFYILHEAIKSFDKDTLTKDNITDVISHLVRRTLPDLREEPVDMLKTSPFDGKSFLQEHEIFNLVLQERFQEYARNLTYLPLPLKEEEIKKITVKQGIKFYTIQVITQEEKIIDYVIPTLLYEWNNLDDHYKLLKYAGYELEKPTLNKMSPQESSEAALKDIFRIKALLIECVHHFEKTAIEYVKKSGVQDYYLKTYTSLVDKFEKDLFFKMKK